MIKVIDDILPHGLFDSLQNTCTDWRNMPWFFNPTSAYPHRLDNVKKYEDQSSWAHMAIIEGNDNSPVAQLCRIVAPYIIKQYEMENVEVLRARFGMHTIKDNYFVNDAHVDSAKKHLGALLYLNDSDGDTIFWDKALPEGEDPEEFFKNNNFEVLESIEPKANRCVLFSGDRFHSSSTPTKTPYRITLNFNFKY